jgi:hypothetical protein
MNPKMGWMRLALMIDYADVHTKGAFEVFDTFVFTWDGDAQKADAIGEFERACCDVGLKPVDVVRDAIQEVASTLKTHDDLPLGQKVGIVWYVLYVPCASATKLLGGGPILETGVNTMACFG